MTRAWIVIADHNVLIQEAIRVHLETELDVVAAVEDGRAALHAVNLHQSDVLLLDGSLPYVNGFAVARSARESCPGVKIIFVTAEAARRIRRRRFERVQVDTFLKAA